MRLPSQTSQPDWVERLDELHLLTPARIIAIVIVAIAVVSIARRLISRTLRRTIGLPGVDRARADARQQALVTALKSAILGVVWAVAVVAIISEVGVNIGGFVATATIIGGAVAFGAQTLIRDLIGGFFVLAEDQYGVGDSVDVGHATGVVERITLRTVRLRDGDGRVWHVPHGGVIRVANLSKAPVALLDLEVARSMSRDQLERIAALLGNELREHPEAAALLAGEPEVGGITDVRDDRLVYRIRVATTAGKHDDVRRIWRTIALGAFERGDLVAPTVTVVSFVPLSASE